MRQSSNRTFMELKQQTFARYFPTYQGSNRTFMELKYYNANGVDKFNMVLIVPLWN